jgi:RND superfamily putative drug exporter
MATLLHRLGLAAVRHRFAVIAIWLVALVAVGAGAAMLSGKTVNTFEIPGQESTIALDLVEKHFGSGANGASAQVVLQAPEANKITEPAYAVKVTTVLGELRNLPGVANATDPLDPKAPTVSADQRAAFSTVSYSVQAGDITEAQRTELLDVAAHARSAGLTAEVTGEATNVPTEVGGPAEIVGVVIALLVLAVTFGSLVAAGMNLLTAVVGVAIGALGITTLTGFVDLQSTTPILAVMLGLAVGIDYALFIMTRFRYELQGGRSVPDAAGMAVGTAGSAVVTAGVTVVIALSGLAIAGIPFLTEMGLAAAATIVVAVLVAITLVPAVLGLIGMRALSRRTRRRMAAELPGRHAAADDDTVQPRTEDDRGGFYGGWVRAVTGNRSISLLIAVATLAVIAIPVFSMRTTLAAAPADGTTQARATQILSDRFGPGFTGPLLILVEGNGAPTTAATIARQAPMVPDVAVAARGQTAADGTAALVTVIPKSSPSSETTVELVHALRDRFGGPGVYVTGSTAVSVDVSQKLNQALPVYLVIVVGLALVLLILVFRSILVPLTGVLGFLLTIGASLGATTAVFQWGWLSEVVRAQAIGPLLSLMPIIVIGILFGLAMDYQVFLVSRMHENHAHGAAPRAAIVTGFRQAAPVVVAAACIMFAVFAGFVPDGDPTLKSVAFALAIGIVFDAFVVRMIAVPAALAMLGRAAWWLPRWLRWLPVLDVEGGAALQPTTAEPTDRAGTVAPELTSSHTP